MKFFLSIFSFDSYFVLGNFSLFGLFVLGIIILVYGSKYILLGASNLARIFHISEYIIGITVVAISTSLPEFFVSVEAAKKGVSVISLANVVGSNIFNIVLIFMLLCLFAKGLLKIKIITILLLSLLNISILIMSLFNISPIPSVVGGGYLFGLLMYFYWELRHSKRNVVKTQVTSQYSVQYSNKFVFSGISVILLLLGVVMLYIGAEVFLNSIRIIGVRIGIPNSVMGIIFVALGTSLPELMVTITVLVQMTDGFSRKSKGCSANIQDMAEGNLIGSNLINILGVLGLTATFHPIIGISQLLFDIVVMTIAIFILLLLVFQKKHLQKLTGILLLVVLVLYLGYIYSVI